MHHSLTGSGVAVACADIVLLVLMLAAELDLADWIALADVLRQWHWARKPLTVMINILSAALPLRHAVGVGWEALCRPSKRLEVCA
jgi:squalene monooxygenase